MTTIQADKQQSADIASSSAARLLFDRQRSAFAADSNPPLPVRIDRLERLLSLTERIAAPMIEAIGADFGYRSAHVTRLTDIMMVAAAIRHSKRNLRR